jgi:hypothetical protein
MIEKLTREDIEDKFDEKIHIFSRQHAPLIGWTPQRFKGQKSFINLYEIF